jgi:hypothetical protein
MRTTLKTGRLSKDWVISGKGQKKTPPFEGSALKKYSKDYNIPFFSMRFKAAVIPILFTVLRADVEILREIQASSSGR